MNILDLDIRIRLPIHLDRQTVMFLTTVGSVLLLLLFVIIFPYNNTIQKQKDEIAQLQFQIKEQKVLYPMYRTLIENGQKESSILDSALNDDAQKPKDTVEILSQLKQSAITSGLYIDSIVPELKSLTFDAKYIPFIARMRGHLIHFRAFLLQVGRFSFLEHIEEIDITSSDGRQWFRVKLWVITQNQNELKEAEVEKGT